MQMVLYFVRYFRLCLQFPVGLELLFLFALSFKLLLDSFQLWVMAWITLLAVYLLFLLLLILDLFGLVVGKHCFIKLYFVATCKCLHLNSKLWLTQCFDFEWWMKSIGFIYFVDCYLRSLMFLGPSQLKIFRFVVKKKLLVRLIIEYEDLDNFGFSFMKYQMMKVLTYLDYC